jgi:hypothetical protein
MSQTRIPIATTTLTTSAADVTFSSISGAYTDLILIISGSNTTNDDSYGLRFNSDTGSNYSLTGLYGSGSSAGSYRSTSTTKIECGRANTSQSVSIINIQNYSNSSIYKTIISRGNTNAYMNSHGGLWRNTAAITAINITTFAGYTIASGSTFTLYGIKAE